MCKDRAQYSVGALRRWEEHGGHWRTLALNEGEAVVELLTCLGEAAETVQSTDPALVAYVAGRRQAGASPTHRSTTSQQDGEHTGKASFPASDPPASWNWEPGGPREQ